MKRVIKMKFDLDVFFEEDKQVKNSFEQPEISFKLSLGVNPKLKFEINNVYERTLNNYARFILGGFQLTLFEKAEQMIRIDQDDEIEELILAFTQYMKTFFDETHQYINFNSIDDIEELKYILTLCLFLVDDALDEMSVELLFDSFFQAESRIKREFKMFDDFYFDSNISFNDDEDISDLVLDGESYVLYN